MIIWAILPSIFDVVSSKSGLRAIGLRAIAHSLKLYSGNVLFAKNSNSAGAPALVPLSIGHRCVGRYSGCTFSSYNFFLTNKSSRLLTFRHPSLFSLPLWYSLTLVYVFEL